MISILKVMLMPTERRDDIGGKVLVAIMSGTIMLLITVFVNAAWTTANQGLTKSNEVSERVTSLETGFVGFKSDIKDIKDILTRKFP